MGDDERPDFQETDYEDDPDDVGDGSTFVRWPRDPKTEPAKADLLKWFRANADGVFYGRQLEVIFEKQYFHWITHKALNELVKQGVVLSEIRTTLGGNQVRLYWFRSNRYWRRAAQELVQLVHEHSSPDLTKALGHHAESLFAVAAGREGFKVDGPVLNSYGKKKWTDTEHDLDWVFSRDGVAWGVEIKNTWAYIPRAEMFTKIALCKHLGLRPLFIMRWAPKSYIEHVRMSGGFCLLYEFQYFPVGHTAAMQKLQSLSLPVISPTLVAPGVFERFVKWHTKGISM